MLTFSHSGGSGDIFLALSSVKALGGGHFYIKLRNMDRVVQEYMGWPNAGVHAGRMTEHDIEVMREFIEHQPYITGCSIWAGEPVDYDLDRMAAGHHIPDFPRNFPNLYARTVGLDPTQMVKQLQIEPWMECREPVKIPGKPVAVFRGPRYQEGNEIHSEQWQEWIDWGLCDQAFYIGLPQDHQWFCDVFKVNIHHHVTPTFWDMARAIAGSEMLITSMSSPCAVGLALGKTMWIETRKNIEMERLEVNFPWRTNVFYF
jgi:hypothetical protein